MYREYVPTCVETLFGRQPIKFKARAIIPESKTLNMETGHCRCCDCQKYNPPIQNASYSQEDYTMQGNNVRYKCIMNCPDCRKQTKKKQDMVASNEGAYEQRRFKARTRNRRVDKTHYECYCAPQIDCSDDEHYPEGRTRVRHKAIKKKSYSSDPSRSTESADHHDSERFCSVCQLWVRSDPRVKRNEFSRKRCDVRDCIDDRNKTTEDNCSCGYKFIVESCRFCGNRREEPNESDKKGEHCKALQNLVQTQRLCALGKQVEQCSRSEGFFTIKPLEDKLARSNEKEKDISDEIFEKFAAEIASLEHYPEATREEEVIIRHFSQEGVLSPNREQSPNRKDFMKAHSTSEIENIEKQRENTNDILEKYKEQLISELNGTSHEKPQQTSDFRSCNCEYARKDWKVEVQSKIEPNKSEIRLLRKKCDEALIQLEQFKREIAESKKGKCHCDLESALWVVQDCKQRCTQLEKQVGYLKRYIENRNTRPKAMYEEGISEIRHPQVEMQKQERPIQSGNRKRDEVPEVITPKVKTSKKPKSTCPPPRERNMGCQHMRCFPQEQVPEIASFKMCPGFPGTSNKR